MEGGGMEPKDVFSLGLGLSAPWKLAGQRLDTEKRPHELHLEVVADRGALFPCPDCQRACKAHDFESFTWRHLNFFQHHCLITARVPRVDCPDHGVKRVTVPWARAGSRFTLLFEQAALILAHEMPAAAAARFMGITDKRLWRVLQHYVARAVGELDLGSVRAVGLDETASKRGHNYVTVFIDMDRADKPVIFATPGKGKACVAIAASRPGSPRSSATCRRPSWRRSPPASPKPPSPSTGSTSFSSSPPPSTRCARPRRAPGSFPRPSAGPSSGPATPGSPTTSASRSPSWRPAASRPPRPTAPRRCCVGSATPRHRKPPAGASPASSITSAPASSRPRCSIPSAARWAPSPPTSSASSSAGGHPTPTPASKA